MPETLVRWIGGAGNKARIEFNVVQTASGKLGDETIEAGEPRDGRLTPTGALKVAINEFLTVLNSKAAGTIDNWRIDSSVGFVWYDEAFEVDSMRTTRRQETRDVQVLQYADAICNQLATVLSNAEGKPISVARPPKPQGRPVENVPVKF